MSRRPVNRRLHGAIVMAAGAGTRIGHRPKCLLERDGVSLIERLIRLLAAAGLPSGVVVLGHHAPRILPLLQKIRADAACPMDLRWAINSRPDDGPGSSLRTGLRALPPGKGNGVMVALADQPLIEACDIEWLIKAWHARGPNVSLLVPQHQGTPGHPLILDRWVMQDTLRAAGGEGVREWRQRHPERVQRVTVDHPRYTLDIDTEDERQALAGASGICLDWPADLR